jgi:hypothetical protein|tara:strand:+ start:3314 stop:4003 length:690 start_codon:yes stop_codon:yes gene_type:complete
MFADLDAAALIPNNTGSVPNAQGVYQLFLRGRLVYIGKTDAQAGLKQRLSRHAWNIKSRHNLDVKEITFKAIQVLVFSAMDLETALISFYREADGPPVWNGSGFGNNDPGRRRDTTALKPEGFDALYPINIDLDVEAAWETAASALGALSTLSAAVPYTIRHEKTADALVELKNAKPQPPQGPTSVRRAVSEICSSLPSGWQATRLSGRVIIYREAKDDYPGGEIIARS